jgi:hypothetical protein
LAAKAAHGSSRGTSNGTMACQAGDSRALSALTRNMYATGKDPIKTFPYSFL